MKTIGIYKITSPTDKVYIGQSRDIEKRFKDYYNLRNCSNQKALRNSFMKYGPDKHTFKIIEECDFEELNIRERHWQDFYEVLTSKGLNCCLVGTNKKPHVMSEESKKKISIAAKNRKRSPLSEEHKRKIGDAHRGKILTEEQLEHLRVNSKKLQERGSSPMKGKKHTEEAKNKIRKARLGTNRSIETKKKISEANKKEKNPMWGKVHTKEVRKKISEAVNKNKPNAKIVFDKKSFVFYMSIREAALYNDMCNSRLSRILKGEFINKTNLILV